jgi:hypothetical protein
MVDEVDKQSLNMGSIMILIGHYHYTAVAKALNILIFTPHLYSKNLDEVLYLGILHDLLVRGLPHI